MPDVLHSVREMLLSSLHEIIVAATAGVILYIRSWVQSHVAVRAAEDAERQPDLLNHEKKIRAMAAVRNKLPVGIRPLTTGGLGRLVDSAVPKAKKRVSDRPGPPSEPPSTPNLGNA